MQFRIGLFLGLAIGYVLGAKAGRARYEQIMKQWRTLRRSDSAQQLEADMRVAAAKAGETIDSKTSEGVAKVTGIVRGGTAEGSYRA